MARIPRLERRLIVKHIESVADDQYGVVSPAQIRNAGLTRWDVRTQVEAGRWRRIGRNTIAVHRGDLPQRGLWWHALFEVGPRAALDGVTALQAAGLFGFEAATMVSLPHGERTRSRPANVQVKVTKWRSDADIMGGGVPRVRPNIAAVRGALWAVSDRQAAYILILAVQQRLTTPNALTDALGRVRRHSRRSLVGEVIGDITDGVLAMGELDFARWCRRYGLPTPSRQVVRRGRDGKVYLDVYWDDFGLVVEIEGIHHFMGVNPVDDALRQNELTLASDAVLRVPVLGLRLAPDAFMDQVARFLSRPR
jgi:hypothetical protein